MSNIIQKIFVIAILGSSILLGQTIKISTGEWEPWVSQNLKKDGVAIDIVTTILKSQGIKSKITFYPWKRAYDLAKKGKFDDTCVWFKNEKREKVFNFSDAIFSTQDVLIYKKGKNIQYKTIDDLKKYKVAITRGYSYGKEIDTMIKNKEIKIKIVNNDLLGLKQIIKRDNFDIFLCANSVARALIADNFTKEESMQFEFHPTPTITNPLYFLVSKKTKNHKKILDAFNIGLKEFKSKGLVKKMINDSYKGMYK